ncbi:hypothetical protein KCU93_g5389, partial [Aureobasidium melanogenum]
MMAANPPVNPNIALSQYIQLREIAGLQTKNKHLLQYLPEDAKLVYATSHGDVEALKSSLEDKDEELTTEIQLSARRVQSLLRNVDDVESRLKIQEAILSAADSQLSASLHDETIQKISGLCADFAIRYGYQFDATPEEHDCMLKPVIGSTEAAWLQSAFSSPAEGGYSMAQVSRGLRTLINQAQEGAHAKSTDADKYQALEKEKQALEAQQKLSQQALDVERRAVNEEKRRAAASAGKLQDAENKITRLEQENAFLPGLRTHIDDLEAKLKQERSRGDQLDKTNAALQSSSKSNTNSLIQERDSYKQRADDLAKKAEELEEDLAVVRDNYSALQTELNSVESDKATSVESAVKDAENKRQQAELEVMGLITQLENSQNLWARALIELLASNLGSEISVNAISLILKQSDPCFTSLDDFK